MADGFRVNLYRQSSGLTDRIADNVGENVADVGNNTSTDTKTDTENTITDTKTDTENTSTNTENTSTDTENAITDTEKVILNLIHTNPSSTLDELAKDAMLSKSGVRYILRRLRARGIVIREGAQKIGKWIILRQ